LYGRRWKRARLTWLLELCACNGASEDCPQCHGGGYPHRFCKECFAESGVLHMTLDLEVDHIRPHRGDPSLFWDRSNNWQALCSMHHSAKTAREDGGFGNRWRRG